MPKLTPAQRKVLERIATATDSVLGKSYAPDWRTTPTLIRAGYVAEVPYGYTITNEGRKALEDSNG